MLKAIVLGGTIPHKELTRQLNKRGYFTILVDYFDNPPAASEANKHIKESCLDKEVVLEIAQNENVDLVIAACIDQALCVACYVAEKLNLPKPFSYQTALEVTNKSFMKKKLIDNNIPTSKFELINQGGLDISSDLKYPLVVKPVDANSSKGVQKITKIEDLFHAVNIAFNLSNDKKVIIEEFVEGKEIGVDCFITNSDVEIIMLHQKRKPQDFGNNVMYSIGSISPPLISYLAFHRIKLIVKSIAKAFNLANTPLLLQAIVNGDDVSVIEFSPRIGGGLNFSKIFNYTKFDILNAAIDSFLNIPVIPVYAQPNFYFSENHVFASPGVYKETVDFEELVKDGVIEEIRFNKQSGDQLSDELVSGNRVFSYVVKGSSIDEIKQKIEQTLRTVKILDSENNSVLRYELYKDLYLA